MRFPESIQENLEEKYGLDRPLVRPVREIRQGRLHATTSAPRWFCGTASVNDIVAEHFPPSLELGFLAMIFALTLGIPLGMLSALRANTSSTTGRCSSRTSASRFRAFSSRRSSSTSSPSSGETSSAFPTSGWSDVAVEGPADDRARARADGVLRTADARNDARDPAAGLHPHGEGQGPPLAANRRQAHAP